MCSDACGVDTITEYLIILTLLLLYSFHSLIILVILRFLVIDLLLIEKV